MNAFEFVLVNIKSKSNRHFGNAELRLMQRLLHSPDSHPLTWIATEWNVERCYGTGIYPKFDVFICIENDAYYHCQILFHSNQKGSRPNAVTILTQIVADKDASRVVQIATALLCLWSADRSFSFHFVLMFCLFIYCFYLAFFRVPTTFHFNFQNQHTVLTRLPIAIRNQNANNTQMEK